MTVCSCFRWVRMKKNGEKITLEPLPLINSLKLEILSRRINVAAKTGQDRVSSISFGKWMASLTNVQTMSYLFCFISRQLNSYWLPTDPEMGCCFVNTIQRVWCDGTGQCQVKCALAKCTQVSLSQRGHSLTSEGLFEYPPGSYSCMYFLFYGVARLNYRLQGLFWQISISKVIAVTDVLWAMDAGVTW